MIKYSIYDIIKKMVERLILPKYPELKIQSIDSWAWGAYRTYDVRFLVKTKPSSELQQEIDSEVKNLFKMASLDEIEKGRFEKNVIKVWFKTPREKEWSFKKIEDYEH